ncbi:hypothetical protein ACHAWU_003394 [Discostella pseudostelligera]|uniref:E2 ubiquitin-conjugating enzyme n=1 Tax=Discostella pseudostelligera TaxID=259834 RepID=A0ABD3MM45_9STRA
MASPLATKRLQRELKALHKNPLSNPKIIATPHESNILEWHYVLEGPTNDPKSPYSNGIYHGKLIFPKEYPYKPPGVIMCTPNGRFKPNRRLCLSMSDFHPESWNPMWSISTILMGLYSFMLDNKPTTGSIETTDAAKRKYAMESLEYNVKNEKIFCILFPEYVELWNQREDERKAKLALAGGGASATAGSGDETMDIVPTNTAAGVMMMNHVFAFGAGFVAVLSIFFAILRFTY